MQETLIINGVEYVHSIKFKILERKLQESNLEIKRLNEFVSSLSSETKDEGLEIHG